MTSDAAGFAQVITEAQSTWHSWAADSFQPYDPAELTATWRTRLAQGDTVAFCAEQDGALAAVAAAGPEVDSFDPSDVSDTSAHLSTLFARPAAHGSGVAQHLHDTLLAELAARGFTTVRLWVPAGAQQARRFYLRNGWTETGARTAFAGLERIEMRRSVPAHDATTLEWHLRAQRADDLEILAQLLVDVDTAWGEVPFRVAVRAGGLEAAREVIARPFIESVVAERAGRVVGYAVLRDNGDGTLMAANGLVSPELQGHGIGTALVSELCSRSGGRHVHGEVLFDSVASRKMLLNLGFTDVAAIRGKVSGREGRLMCWAPAGSESCPPLC